MGDPWRPRTPGILVFLALAGTLAIGAQPAAVTWSSEEYSSDLRELEALSPRLEGSTREGAALRYIRARLEAAGAAVREISYAESETVHSFSSGLEAAISGASADTLVIVVPVDHVLRVPAGRDGSATIAAALQVARSLQSASPPLGVRILFLGAEHGSGDEYPIGSRRYIEGYYLEAGVAVLYLDIAAIPSRLSIRSGTNGIVAPSWLVRSVAGSLEAAGLSFRLRGNESQVYRLGAGSETASIAPYLRAGLPALALEGVAEQESTGRAPEDMDAEAWLRSFGGFLDGLIQTLGRDGIPEEWDRHYLSIQLGGRTLTIPEGTYVLILCGLVAACLAYAVLSGRRGRRYAVAFLKGIWSVPAHLLLVFLYAFLPTLLIEFLLAVLNFPTLWQLAPLELLLLKVLLGVSLFMLVTPLVTRTPLPRTDTFYAASGIVLIVASLVGTAIYEVSLASYFAWALVFMLLSVVARDRAAKILLFVIAPAWLLRAVVELFWLHESQFVRWVLLDRLWGNVLITAAASPFYFMVLRLRLLLPARRRRRRRLIIAALGLLCLVAASATAAWIGSTRPYRNGDARPIQARALFDYQSGIATLQLDCPIAIREFTVVTTAGANRTVTRALRASLAIESSPQPLAVSSSASTFLDRQNVLLLFAPATDSTLWPHRLSLRLVGDAEFVLFDASFPFVRDPSGREYVIRIGASPPSPLSLELTLPRGIGFEVRIVADYLEFPPQLAVLSPGAVIEPQTEIRTTYRFRT